MSGARLVLATLTVVGFLCGCAGKPPSGRFDSLFASAGGQVRPIALVVTMTGEEEAVDLQRTGWLSNFGRGAAKGSQLGAVGFVCYGPGIIICVPGLAIVGAIGGGVYGAVASESASEWKEAETAFRTVLADLALDELLSNHLVAFAREHGYEIRRPQDIPLSPKEGWSASALAEQEIHAVLEIRDPTPMLVPAKFTVNPPRRLVVAAQVRLIRTDDEKVLVDRVVSDDLSPVRQLGGWTADNATAFRDRVSPGVRQLAENIVTELFLQVRFRERRIGIAPFLDMKLQGYRPLYPPPWKWAGRHIPEITPLQPTIRWEPSRKHHPTYDLRVWREAGGVVGDLVYQREGLVEPSHKIEEALERATIYFWSVRARYQVDGRHRITEWSKRSVTSSTAMDWLTLGVTKLLPDPVALGYYQFRTP